MLSILLLRFIVLMTFFAALAAAPAAAAPLNLFVSTLGHDSSPGDASRPLATLVGARDRIRTLKQTGRLPLDGVTVWVHGGVYHLDEPFILTAQDDTGPIPVTYRASNGEVVELDGGRDISGWKPVTDPTVLDRLDPAARGHVLQADLRALGVTDYGTLTQRGFGLPVTPAGLELFFNGAAMPLARWPNDGQWATIAGTATDQGTDYFTYAGDRPARWSPADDIWIHGYWAFDWADSYEKVLSISPSKHRIYTHLHIPVLGPAPFVPHHRWYAFNVLEELDSPSEWYLDRANGLLYFWPPSNAAQGRAIVSTIDNLVRLDHVGNVTLRGFILECCRGTAVSILDGTRVRLAGCTIRDIGNLGVDIEDGKDVGVQSCDISATGDGGVILNGGDRKTLMSGSCFVDNCRIHDYSRWDRTYRPGIAVEGVGNRAAHNIIYDAPHNAILLSGNDHVIEYNEIHDVCRETGDAGAFYMGRDWTMRGDVVRFNYFHDIGGASGLIGFHDAMAVYLDDTASGATIFGNVFVRAGHAVMIGGGRDDTVENNVFVDCHPAVSLDARGLGWAAAAMAPGGGWNMLDKLNAVPYNQPPYSTRYPHLANLLQDDPAAPKYDVIATNIAFRCANWIDIQKEAVSGVRIEHNLIDTDPQFRDATGGDFQLKPSSPALQAGFHRIPFDRIGLYKDEYRRDIAGSLR